MVRPSPVAGGDPMLLSKAVPRQDVPGRARTEDGQEMFQHVAAGHQVSVPLRRVAQPGLRRTEMQDAVCRHTCGRLAGGSLV